MPLRTYAAYGATTLDEMPLYLFDKKCFTAAAPALLRDFSVPDVFREDLLGVLGEDKRPDYRRGGRAMRRRRNAFLWHP